MKQSKKVKEKNALSRKYVHPDPLLNRIYQNRGIESPDELCYSLAKLLSPWGMKDIDKAVDKIIEHIHMSKYRM